MQVVILAGGLATRLGEKTLQVPKSMLEIHGQAFLAHQLKLLRKHGLTDIVLCVGHHAEKITDHFGDGKKFGVRLRYSAEKERLLGTGGALKNAEGLLEEAFFVMYGDSYLMLDYAAIEKTYRAHPAEALMVVLRNKNRYDRSNLEVKDGWVREYDAKGQREHAYIDEGISVLTKPFLAKIKKDVFGLGELFSLLVDENKLRAYETEQRFYEIGSLRGLEEFREFAKQELID